MRIWIGVHIAVRKSTHLLQGELILILSHLKRLVVTSVQVLRARFVHWTKPFTSSLPLGTLADLGRSKAELVAGNALLRQQLIILKRQVKRPACTKTDRILLVLLGKSGSGMEANAFPCPARNPPGAHIVKHFVCIGGASQRLILTSRRQTRKPSC